MEGGQAGRLLFSLYAVLSAILQMRDPTLEEIHVYISAGWSSRVLPEHSGERLTLCTANWQREE